MIDDLDTRLWEFWEKFQQITLSRFGNSNKLICLAQYRLKHKIKLPSITQRERIRITFPGKIMDGSRYLYSLGKKHWGCLNRKKKLFWP